MISDQLQRPLRSLRISVTDRCNLRCTYCMPEKEYVWLPRKDILEFEEIRRLAWVFQELGVDRVRLTGGEPLVRKDLPQLVEMLAGLPGIRDLAMTTNGVYLPLHGQALLDAGLQRVTISLDTLRRDRFEQLTGRDDLAKVLAGIEHAARLAFRALKINTVVVRGYNDDELVDLVEYGRQVGAEVRFIEYMDVGGATRWDRDDVFSKEDMLACLTAYYGSLEPGAETSHAPADRWSLPDGTVFGIISSTTAPFCQSCNRSRVTADGMWYLCLYGRTGVDLRRLLRGGASDAELRDTITAAWQTRADRGAEERLSLQERSPLASQEELLRDPHLEMHTRGG